MKEWFGERDIELLDRVLNRPSFDRNLIICFGASKGFRENSVFGKYIKERGFVKELKDLDYLFFEDEMSPNDFLVLNLAINPDSLLIEERLFNYNYIIRLITEKTRKEGYKRYYLELTGDLTYSNFWLGEVEDYLNIKFIPIVGDFKV